jgi:uncharacterized OB-fold protein
MKDFFYYLQRGQLRIPTCCNCHQKVWPPNQFCSQCFSRRIDMVKADSKGRIIEFSKSHNKNNPSELTYGLIEISGVRLIGSIVGKGIEANSSVLLRRCGLTESKNAFYEFLMDVKENRNGSTKSLYRKLRRKQKKLC